ncbi:MAG: hypothetical protein L6Q92_12110 [Phycisphaerae bacterium]|nr:hypothetical protein [Phycisphaerae bacterium]
MKLRPSMQQFVIWYRYKKPGDKAFGPVVQYRLYAHDIAEAWATARQYLNYEGVEIVDVVPI